MVLIIVGYLGGYLNGLFAEEFPNQSNLLSISLMEILNPKISVPLLETSYIEITPNELLETTALSRENLFESLFWPRDLKVGMSSLVQVFERYRRLQIQSEISEAFVKYRAESGIEFMANCGRIRYQLQGEFSMTEGEIDVDLDYAAFIDAWR